jgi:2-amino-4-hydroxy-6-hydroxymethyldihydropteridine diphosphokinase
VRVETTSFIIALGSNQRHGRYGAPAKVIRAAIAALDVPIITQSEISHSAPVGPSLRRYANAAVLIETRMTPSELLNHLQAIEGGFGRRRRGRRWGARVLDLDIILWSAGLWASPGLSIPHPRFRERGFVLSPLNQIARGWRDPITGQSIPHLKTRLDRRHPRN